MNLCKDECLRTNCRSPLSGTTEKHSGQRGFLWFIVQIVVTLQFNPHGSICGAPQSTDRQPSTGNPGRSAWMRIGSWVLELGHPSRVKPSAGAHVGLKKMA